MKDEFKKYETFIHRYLNTRLATYAYKKISGPKTNGYSTYKNAFLKEMPIIIPPETVDFSQINDDEFDRYVYSLIGLDEAEKELIESVHYSQA